MKCLQKIGAIAVTLLLTVPVTIAAQTMPAVAKPFFSPATQASATRAVNTKVSHIDYSARYPGLFIVHGPRTERKVALTFDDGPDLFITPQVLTVLRRENVKATFFLVGLRVHDYPGIVRRIAAEGHAIGNHTWDHRELPKLGLDALKSEANRTDAEIYRSVGIHPALIRPPYGSVNGPVIETLAHMGYRVVDWNVDSSDWRGLGRLQVEQNVLSNVHNGSIILQHSGGASRKLNGTVEALPDIIRELRARGYQFVTVPELLHLPAAFIK